MRIFLSATSLRPSYGGPAYSVARLADALAATGADVGLWAADRSTPTELEASGNGRVQCFFDSLEQSLAKFGACDVIHDNGIWLRHNHRLARIAVRQSIPRVISTRGMLEPWAMGHKKMKKQLAWSIYQKRDLMSAAAHHATSLQEASNLKMLGLEVPIFTIPNGVDIPEVDAASQRAVRSRSERRVAMFLGRLYPVKGLPMLIEAWNQVRPRGWVLQIAGPDESGHRQELERLIAAANLDDVVFFTGPLDRVAKSGALFAADLFVLPSHSESFGIVVAEALAHGLPVLTTHGTPWRGLQERESGWYVPSHTEALARGLREATELESETLLAMGARGRQWMAAEFGWNVVASQFLDVYKRRITGHSTRATD